MKRIEFHEFSRNVLAENYMNEAAEASMIFGQEERNAAIRQLKDHIDAEYVMAYPAALGKDHIIIEVSLEPENKWLYNNFLNSRHSKFMLSRNGELEQITKYYKITDKFRKVKVKSLGDAIKKINEYIRKVS